MYSTFQNVMDPRAICRILKQVACYASGSSTLLHGIKTLILNLQYSFKVLKFRSFVNSLYALWYICSSICLSGQNKSYSMQLGIAFGYSNVLNKQIVLQLYKTEIHSQVHSTYTLVILSLIQTYGERELKTSSL